MALKSEKIFEMMALFLKENGKIIIPKTKAIYRFDVLDKKGGYATSWIVDLKNGNGSVTKSTEGKPDTIFTVVDSDFIELASKKLEP